MPAYQQAPTSAPAPAADGYLESVSNESLEVLQHFGAETPALLNRYACVVEDALLTQAQQTAQALQQLQVTQNQLTNAHTVIEAAAEDNAAYHTLLTNPDLLSNYVKEFFGPNGPYPVETAQDRLAAEVAAGEAQFAPQAPVYQRPQLDMPAPDVQAGSPDSEFWNVFSQISDRRPEMAWQVLSQATPEALRSKILVSEA
jgi:type II secretory pathway pseudopilin PulG